MKKIALLLLIYIGLLHSVSYQVYGMFQNEQEEGFSAVLCKKKESLESSIIEKKERSLQHLEAERAKQLSIKNKPIVLCVLDGWGEREPTSDNAIAIDSKPNWERLMEEWPHTTLHASGEYVGLPKGLRVNSEVGHMNLGAGRVVIQDILRINKSIEDGTLAESPILKGRISSLRETKGCSHVLGQLSPGPQGGALTSKSHT
jgi:hypothetical protein